LRREKGEGKREKGEWRREKGSLSDSFQSNSITDG
jgi:hypothetical protein